MGSKHRIYSRFWVHVLQNLEGSFYFHKHPKRQESNQGLPVIHDRSINYDR